VHLLIDGDKRLFSLQPSTHFFVVALDARTGHVTWRHQLASAANAQGEPGTAAQPIVSGHLVFVTYILHDSQTGEDHGTLDALDLTSGQLRWRHEAGSRPPNLAIVGSTIYLSAVSFSHDIPGSGVVEALDLTSGRLLWSRPVPKDPSQLAVGGDKVFVIADPDASDGGRVVALKASDGSRLWEYSSPLQYFDFYGYSFPNDSATVIGNQPVYVDAVNVVNSTFNPGSLLALNADDGKVAWQHPNGAPVSSLLEQSGGILCRVYLVNQPPPH
jgi:outer membrane protein assembly factor BamB